MDDIPEDVPYVPAMQLSSVQREEEFFVEKLPDDYYHRLHENLAGETDDTMEMIRIQQMEIEKKDKTVAKLQETISDQKQQVVKAAKAAVKELTDHVTLNLEALKVKLLSNLNIFLQADEISSIATLEQKVSWVSDKEPHPGYGRGGVGPKKAYIDSLFRCLYEETRLRYSVTKTHYVTCNGERSLDYKTLWEKQGVLVAELQEKLEITRRELREMTNARTTLDGSHSLLKAEIERVRQQYVSELLLKSQRIRDLDTKLSQVSATHVAKKIPKITEYGDTDLHDSGSETVEPEDIPPSVEEILTEELALCKKQVLEKSHQVQTLKKELESCRHHILSLREELEKRWSLEDMTMPQPEKDDVEEEEDEEEEDDDEHTATSQHTSPRAAGSSQSLKKDVTKEDVKPRSLKPRNARSERRTSNNARARTQIVDQLREEVEQKGTIIEELELQVKDLSEQLHEATREPTPTPTEEPEEEVEVEEVEEKPEPAPSVESAGIVPHDSEDFGVADAVDEEVHALREENSALQDKVSSLLDELTDANSHRTDKEVKLSDALRTSEELVAVLRTDIEESEQENESLTDKIGTLEQQISDLELQIERLRHEIKSTPTPGLRVALRGKGRLSTGRPDGSTKNARSPSVPHSRCSIQPDMPFASDVSHHSADSRRSSVASEISDDGVDVQVIVDDNVRLKRNLDNMKMTLEDSRSNLRLLKEAQASLIAEYRVFKEQHLMCTEATGEDPDDDINSIIHGLRGGAGESSYDVMKRIVIDQMLLRNETGEETAPLEFLVMEALASGKLPANYLVHFLTDDQLSSLNEEAARQKMQDLMQQHNEGTMEELLGAFKESCDVVEQSNSGGSSKADSLPRGSTAASDVASRSSHTTQVELPVALSLPVPEEPLGVLEVDIEIEAPNATVQKIPAKEEIVKPVVAVEVPVGVEVSVEEKKNVGVEKAQPSSVQSSAVPEGKPPVVKEVQEAVVAVPAVPVAVPVERVQLPGDPEVGEVAVPVAVAVPVPVVVPQKSLPEAEEGGSVAQPVATIADSKQPKGEVAVEVGVEVVNNVVVPVAEPGQPAVSECGAGGAPVVAATPTLQVIEPKQTDTAQHSEVTTTRPPPALSIGTEGSQEGSTHDAPPMAVPPPLVPAPDADAEASPTASSSAKAGFKRLALAAGSPRHATGPRIEVPFPVTDAFVTSILKIPFREVLARIPEFTTFLSFVPNNVRDSLKQQWALGAYEATPLLTKTVHSCLTQVAMRKEASRVSAAMSRKSSASTKSSTAPSLADDASKVSKVTGGGGGGGGTLKDRLRQKTRNMPFVSVLAQKAKTRQLATPEAVALTPDVLSASGMFTPRQPVVQPTAKSATADLSEEAKRQLISHIHKEYVGFEGAIEYLDLLELSALVKLEMTSLLTLQKEYAAFGQTSVQLPTEERALQKQKVDRRVLLEKFKMYRTLEMYSGLLLFKLRRRKDNILRSREETLSKVLDAVGHISNTHPKEAATLLDAAKQSRGMNPIEAGFLAEQPLFANVSDGGCDFTPVSKTNFIREPPAAKKRLHPLPRAGPQQSAADSEKEETSLWMLKRKKFVAHRALTFQAAICGNSKPSWARPGTAENKKIQTAFT